MAMYNKLFAKILVSSIWLEPYPTRIVWTTLLAAMDEDGFVQMASIENLAGVARVTVEEAKEAIDKFQKPDRKSSDPENSGRRVERVPGGWIVLNASKYRNLVSREIIKESTRERVRAWRARKKESAKASHNGNETKQAVTMCDGLVTSSDTDTREREERREKHTPAPLSPSQNLDQILTSTDAAQQLSQAPPRGDRPPRLSFKDWKHQHSRRVYIGRDLGLWDSLWQATDSIEVFDAAYAALIGKQPDGKSIYYSDFCEWIDNNTTETHHG